MSAHLFVASSAGSSTASANWSTHAAGYTSRYGNWQLVKVGGLGLHELSRKTSGVFAPIAGGAVSQADLRALWTGLLGAKAEDNNGTLFDGGQWKTLDVSSGTFNLQRKVSGTLTTLAGGTLKGEQLDELRELLLLRIQ